MNKTLAILSIFLLAVMGMASATMDISVDNIGMTPSNPIEGQNVTFTVTITNVGSENFTAATGVLDIDFDDTTTDTGDIPALLIGASVDVTFTHAYTTANSYTVTATYNAGDDNATNDEATNTITVDELNVAPEINPISDVIVIVGSTYTYNVIATDANAGDTLTYSLTGPTGMIINSVTGQITWSPTIPVSATTVTVTVSDGELSASTTFSASAKIDRAEISFVGNEILLGGSNYERGDSASKTIEIENTGTRTITNLALELTNTRNNELNSDYNAYVALNKNSLAPGEKAVATISVTIPEDANSKETRIGKLKVTALDGTTTLSDTVDVLLEAESFLEISNIDIYVNGKDEGRLDDGDNYDNILEGDKVKLEIKVENKFDDKDFDINNVYAELSDDNWDIDESTNEKDISGKDDYTFTVEFTVDDKVNDDIDTVLIQVYGDDDQNDYEHYDEWEISFEITRKNNDIRIKDVSFNKNPIDCTADSVTMDVTLRNYGEKDNDEIFLYAYSEEANFKWNAKKTYISLDSGDETTRSFVIDLPKGLPEDSYVFTIEAKYDISKDADEKLAVLDAVCYNEQSQVNNGEDGSNENTNTSNNDGLIINTENNNQNNNAGNYVPTGNVVYGQPKTGFEEFTTSTTYLVLLAVLVVVVLAIIIGWLGSLLRK